MDKKTKNRMLGALVVAALVLFSLPFLQSGKESTSGTSLVKAPPFPDQVAQVNSTPAETELPPMQPSPIPMHDPSQKQSSAGFVIDPDDTIKADSEASTSHPPSPVPPGQEDNQSSVKKLDPTQPAPVSNNDPKTMTPPSTKATPLPQTKDQVVTPGDGTESPEGTDYIFRNNHPTLDTDLPKVKSKKTKHTHPSHIRVIKMQSASLKKSMDKNGLFKLNTPVWVIQIGSFKNKENAFKLVNKLRVNGYHAFIQQMANHTQVFVGPENKQHAARLLKNQLEAKLHISGVVISYKPLSM